MISRILTGPPQPSGWFSQIAADNPPVIPENRNVRSAHPPVLLATLAGVPEPTEPHSRHPPPNARAAAMLRLHRPMPVLFPASRTRKPRHFSQRKCYMSGGWQSIPNPWRSEILGLGPVTGLPFKSRCRRATVSINTFSGDQGIS